MIRVQWLWLLVLLNAISLAAPARAAAPADLWQVARSRADSHRFSTLFTARQVTEDLANDTLIDEAIEWCKSMGITKVYLETFRSRHRVEADTIAHARDRFREAGFLVSGCVTTTQIGRISTGWNLISCYSDSTTQQQTRDIFEFTAELFDEIMIDDFWFTDCECQQCRAALAAQQVQLGDQVWPVASNDWAAYRCELMLRVSQTLVIEPARRVNPDVSLIIKYPQWYDDFQRRGYDVVRETASFDTTWVGTEIRDEYDERWGGRGRLTAYFLQSWLEGVSGGKCGGGWYDTLGTTPATYLVQARQTILGGAKESMLFNAGNLRKRSQGLADAEALREALPDLLDLAENVKRRSLIGMSMYKPPHSSGEDEKRVFEFVGMLGIPFVTCHEFPADAPAAFFSLHALQDEAFVDHFERYVKLGRPTLITDALADRLRGSVDIDRANVRILEVQQKPESIPQSISTEKLTLIRAAMTKPFSVNYEGPSRTALYYFDDGSWVLESYRNSPLTLTVNGKSVDVQPNGWAQHWN